MSARAAWRLETLGFPPVFRYKPGKEAWFAYGLPIEGARASIPRAGDVARRDVPTCQLTERIGDVQMRIRALGWDQCIVVGPDNVVLGRVRHRQLGQAPELPVEEVMEPGPTTIRPDTILADLVARMQARRVGTIIVTNPDGQLLGVVLRRDAEQRLAVIAGHSEQQTEGGAQYLASLTS